MRQLGLVTFLTDRIVHSLETMMAATSAGPALTGLLLRQHSQLLHTILNSLFENTYLQTCLPARRAEPPDILCDFAGFKIDKD